MLSSLSAELEGKGVRLVAVGCSREDAQEFVKARRFAGDIFLDEKKILHNILGCKQENWVGFVKPKVWLAFKRAVARGIEVKPTKGDFNQLGGTFLIDLHRNEIIFSHLQTRWGDHPSALEILEALGMGDTEDDLSFRAMSETQGTVQVFSGLGWIQYQAHKRRQSQLIPLAVKIAVLVALLAFASSKL